MSGWRRTADGDSGFGLVETIIALLIAGIVFGALATSLISAVQASLFGRQNQQATDFMTRQLEHLRTMEFGALTHTAADVAGDPRLVSCAAGACLDIDGTLEPVVTGPASGVTPHETVLTDDETNSTDFTVTTYITEIVDPLTGAPEQPVEQAVRATIYVTWVNRGELRERSTSSILAFTQRGLPLPVFRLELPVHAISVNPGSDIVYSLNLTNQGAPDRWNLSWSGYGSGWTFYADSDGSGDLDVTLDTALTDTTLDGIVDTGRVDPGTTFNFFARRTTTPVEPEVADQVTTFQARSAGQPDPLSSALREVDASTTVTTAPIPPAPGPAPTGPPLPPEPDVCAAPAIESVTNVHGGYTVREFTLHNDGVGDTPVQAQMYWSESSGDESGLWHYSTDVDPSATGRVLSPAGGSLPSAAAALALTDATKFADWTQQQGAKRLFDGTAVVRLWVEAPTSVDMKVILYTGTSSGAGIARTVLVEKDVVVDGACANFQEMYVVLPDADRHEVPKNDWLGIRVVTAGSDDVRLAYDVPAQFPARLSIGVK